MNDKSIYVEIEPKDVRLKKLIKLYYFHSSSDPDYFQKITYYPNYTTSINIYRNSKVSWTNLSRMHEFDPNGNYLALLVVKFDVSREIIMKGKFDKITIVFNPLGLNHFLRTPLSSVTSDHCSLFSHFGGTFDKSFKGLFEADSIKSKRDILDSFFCEKLVGFKDKIMSAAIEHIFENSETKSVQEISNDLNISRKTLLRLFKKHLLCTPTEYKSMVKFRKTLESYQNNLSKPSFAELAYDGNYYDQSDLNSHFKNRTGLTPKQLLTNIQTITKDLYWTMDGVPKVQLPSEE